LRCQTRSAGHVARNPAGRFPVDLDANGRFR
jgi:hypothetical protein